MDTNKKNLHKKVTANVLGITLASVVAAGAVADVTVPVFAAQQTQEKENTVPVSVYLNGSVKEGKEADGSTKEKAVSSIDKALSLAENNGTIYVCGTVTINTEKKLTIPAGVTLKRAEGFTAPVVKVTGKGKLTVTGNQLLAADVDISGAEAGKNAFVTEKIQEEKKKGTVTIPSAITVATLEEWQNLNFTSAGFVGEGTFVWKDKSLPSAYETEKTVIFLPDNVDKYDYTQVPGWDKTAKQAVRTVKVIVEELKPEEKQEGSVTLPEQVTLQKRADWEGFDFATAGFVGNGTFTWENPAAPEAYEVEKNVIFTPSDAEEKDYSQVPGWKAEAGTVTKTVKVVTEELKTPVPEETPEENPDKDNAEKPEENLGKDEVEKPEETPDKNPDKDAPGKENAEKPEEKPDKESTENQKEEPDKENTEKPDGNSEDKEDTEKENQESDTDKVIITPVEKEEAPEKEDTGKEGIPFQAEQGKNGEVAEKAPEAIPVGSLLDEATGVQVSGDFLPFYVDLQVSYNDAVSELPDAGIGEILSAYELKLWDLKEDEEYRLPEGRKVKVQIPLPENANCYSELSIAHYLGNNEYEYFVFDREGKVGNMWVEELGGKEYLTFETASFSPFNVGGHQIVGPGTSSNNHKPSSGSNAQGSGSTSKPSGSTTGQISQSQKNPSSGTGSTAGKQNQTSVSKKNNTKIIYTVKTGDESNILVYVLAGAVAVVLAVVAIVLGKKKK